MTSYPESPEADHSSADEVRAPAGAEKAQAQPRDWQKCWLWALRRAIGQMDISFGAKETWRILEGYNRDDCWPSHLHLALTLGKSPSAVRRYLRELKDKGYIEIHPRYDDGNTHRRGHKRRAPRGQTSNQYFIQEGQPDLMAMAKQIMQELHAKGERAR